MEKKGVSVAFTENKVTELVYHYKKMETNLKNWIAKPPVLVDAALATIENAAIGAAGSLVLDEIRFSICSAFQIPPPFKALPERLIKARNIAVLIGAGAGITCIMKRTRGKDDVQNRMVAGFGAGVLFAIACRDPPAGVIASGIFFALMEAAMFKAEENLLQ